MLCRPARGLGDAVFALPAYRLLHNAGYHVVVDAPTGVSAEVASACPYVDEVLTGAFRGSTERTFDLCPCERSDKPARSALVERVAFPLQLDADVRIGGNLRCSGKARKSARRLLHGSDSTVVFHMGCSGLSKPSWRPWRNLGHPAAWPLEGFVQLADGLRQAFPDAKFVVVGTGIEAGLAEPFVRQVADSDALIDATSVETLLALIENAVLFVGNDSGPLHLACTTETPVVGLYGAASGAVSQIQPSAPWRREVRSDDMADIGPAAVLAASLVAMKASESMGGTA